jgi:hypothetical protein
MAEQIRTSWNPLVAWLRGRPQRIKSSWTTGADFARRRQLLVFDRFAACFRSNGLDLATIHLAKQEARLGSWTVHSSR